VNPVGAGSGLARRQAELVDALVAGGEVPAGFDGRRIDSTRRALLRKRAGEAAKVWPLLAAAAGPGWAATFRTHLDGRPPGGALRDGWDLARVLDRLGGLAGAAAAELAERETTWRYDGVSAPRRRRLPAARWAAGALFVQVAGRSFRLGRPRA
jgi:hypothetical protein